MRLGLLADVHEDVERLRLAVSALERAGCDRYVLLGDLAETGDRLDELVDVVAALPAMGVWGNHDEGLCGVIDPQVRQHVSAQVLDWFAELGPWIELEGCRFQHIDPHLDPSCSEHLWSFASAEERRSGFACCAHRRVFVGHHHCWSAMTPEGELPWAGEIPIAFDAGQRYLVGIHAVTEGWAALLDTERDVLTPLALGSVSARDEGARFR